MASQYEFQMTQKSAGSKGMVYFPQSIIQKVFVHAIFPVVLCLLFFISYCEVNFTFFGYSPLASIPWICCEGILTNLKASKFVVIHQTNHISQLQASLEVLENKSEKDTKTRIRRTHIISRENMEYFYTGLWWRIFRIDLYTINFGKPLLILSFR